MVYKMIILLCSLSATSYDKCDETNAIAIDRMARIAPYAARCEHDSQHEQAELIRNDLMAHLDASIPPDGKLHLVAGYDPADRKIKVLCIPGS